MKKFVYYGHWYYQQAGSGVGVLYHDVPSHLKTGRSDWGEVQSLLTDGLTITIRPATQAEHAAITMHTAEYIEKAKAAGFTCQQWRQS